MDGHKVPRKWTSRQQVRWWWWWWSSSSSNLRNIFYCHPHHRILTLLQSLEAIFFLAVMASYCKPLLVKSHFFGSWSPNFPCFNLPFCWWKLPCLLLPPGPNCGNPLQVSSLKSAERLELLSELQCLAKLRHPHLCGSLGSSLVFRSGNKQSLGNLRSKKGNWDWIRNWIWNSSPAGFNK